MNIHQIYIPYIRSYNKLKEKKQVHLYRGHGVQGPKGLSLVGKLD